MSTAVYTRRDLSRRTAAKKDGAGIRGSLVNMADKARAEFRAADEALKAATTGGRKKRKAVTQEEATVEQNDTTGGRGKRKAAAQEEGAAENNPAAKKRKSESKATASSPEGNANANTENHAERVGSNGKSKAEGRKEEDKGNKGKSKAEERKKDKGKKSKSKADERKEKPAEHKLFVNTIYVLQSDKCLLVMANGPLAKLGMPAGAVGCVQSREQARRYARYDSRYRNIPKQFLDEAFGVDNSKCHNCMRLPSSCDCDDVLQCDSCGVTDYRGRQSFCNDCGLCHTRMCCECDSS